MAQLKEGSESVLTSNIGTFAWMSPETLCGKPFTNFSDVYSFSVILYILFIF